MTAPAPGEPPTASRSAAPPGAPSPRRTLHLAALVEALSLVVLLANRLTVHWEPVTSMTGPLHGTAYLTVIITGFSLREPALPAAVLRRARLLTLVPGIGGWLAVRRLDRPR